MKGKGILLLSLIWIAMALAACSVQEAPVSQAGSTIEETQPVQAFGVVEALITRDISMDFPVKIEKLQVKEGQVVCAGETLAVISKDKAEGDARLMEDRIKALKLDSAVKQKIYAKKKASISDNKNPEILKLKIALNRAQKTYDSLLNENDTKRTLYKEGVLTDKDLQEYESSVETAEYACKDAGLNLESLQETLNVELLQAEAEINSANTEISGLEKELQDSRLKLLPPNLKGNEIVTDVTRGIICGMNCKSGDNIPAGGKLFGIMDASSFIIEANVDEQFIKDVKPGAKVYINPEFDRSLECKGEVSEVSAFAIEQNGETVIPVSIRPEKQCKWLNPGYNMEVSIEVE